MPSGDKKRKGGTPWVIFALPSMALFVSLLSAVLAGDTEPALAAQVWGGPTDSTSGFRGRVRLVRDAGSVLAPASGVRFRIEAVQGAHRSRRELSSGPEGWAEFSLSRFPGVPLHLSVEKGEQKLAEGAPELSTERWHAAATRRGGPLPFHEENGLRAQVQIETTVLGVPFASSARLVVRDGARPAQGAKYSVRGSSAEIEEGSQGRLDNRGSASFRIRPTHHVASIDVEVEVDDRELKFEQVLPVVPGSLAIEKEGDSIVIRSPIARDEVWYTFVTEQARLSGGRVELSSSERGAEGQLAAGMIPRVQGLFLVLSTEADGRSPATVGFPLDGQHESFEAWDGYLLDGLPQVRARRNARERRTRTAWGAYAGVTGIVTLILFWLGVRSSDRTLERDLSRVGATVSAQSRSPLPLMIAVLCLFFAFSAAVLWIVAR